MPDLRTAVATALVRVAGRVLTGPDDLVVLLNTRRLRGMPGNAGAGRIVPFIVSAADTRVALAFSPEKVPKGLGLPVPQRVAKLAGYKVESIA